MMDQLVWRAKIGLVTTSGQLITEPRFNQLAPTGVTFHTSRMLNPRSGIDGLIEMEKNAPRAVEELASIPVDSLAYCCTGSGALRGLQGDRDFCREMEERWDIPTTSTMLAALEALQHLEASTVVVTCPYVEDHLEPERTYLEEAGIHPLVMRGMGLSSGKEFSVVPPEEIYRFSLDAWDDRADALFISCMNFDAIATAQALEDRIQKPVLTSHTVTLWRALGLAGIDDPIYGCGRLLEQPRVAVKV